MEGVVQKLFLVYIHAQRRALWVERSFMIPEYRSTSWRDIIAPISASNAIESPNFESRNLILLTGPQPRDWTVCDLYESEKKKARSLNLIIKNDELINI